MRACLILFEDPASATHGGVLRSRAFVRAFAELGHELDVVLPRHATTASNAATSSAAVGPVARAKHRARLVKRYLAPMPTAAGALLQFGGRPDLSAYDLIVFCNFEARALLPAASARRVWFDQSDVHSRYAAREGDRRAPLGRRFALLQARWLQNQERRWGRRAPISTCAGYADSEDMRSRGVPALWLPTPVADVPGTYSRSERIPTRTAGFLANFQYEPNKIALRKLLTDWMPSIVEQGWRLMVAGRGSETLSLPTSVRCLGEVDDVAEFYRHIDVSLCPVEFGGGMKVKAAESLVYDVPVIASPTVLTGFDPVIAKTLVTWDAAGPTPALDDIAGRSTAAAAASFTFDAFRNRVSALLASTSQAAIRG